jgi:hypothetical protein
MNKSAFEPLPVLLRAEPYDTRGTSHSAMILRVVATLGTLFALGGTVVLCLIAFNAFPPKTSEAKIPVGIAILPAAKMSAATADQENGVGALPTGTNQGDRTNTAEDHSIADQTPVPALNPLLPPARATPAEASVSDNDLLNEPNPQAGRTTLDRQLPEFARKTLEKKRRAAERQRSRLEEKYQEHTISSEAYKKGQENYRMQIDRYRREMSAGQTPNNEVGQD